MNIGAKSDKELFEMLKDKNKRLSDLAFTEIYDRYSQDIYAYCIRILSNKETAEDIFQETFLRFYDHARKDYKYISIIGILIRIARNLCLNEKRDRKTKVSIEDYNFITFDTNKYENDELISLIITAVELLDHKYREPLVLRTYNELEYSEIADICGISQINARTRVFRAKKLIKETLAPYIKEINNK